MTTISLAQITAYRQVTFRLQPALRLKSLENAVEFVSQRGFILFWPSKGLTVPSLWSAVAGDRPVPDEHDDPAHITWDWKDASLGKRRWFYGRVLHHRNAMIALTDLPYFYALSPNYGSPEEDYLEQYAAGQMTAEARSVYEALLDHGPLDTLDLRRAARMSSRESDGRFNKALDSLQMEFRILPVGISQTGAWNYAFIYDLVPRHFTSLIEDSRLIGEMQARRRLALRYLESVGCASSSTVSRLFRWPLNLARKALDDLVKENTLIFPVELETGREEQYALVSLGV